jgi:hypothetical protein
VTAEAIKILLGKGKVRSAPCFSQFDPFVGRFKHGKLWFGNRHPLQRIKRWALKRYLKKKLGGPQAAQ